MRQLEIFVRNEKSAIQWLRQQLQDKPQGFQEIHPQFMRRSPDGKSTNAQ